MKKIILIFAAVMLVNLAFAQTNFSGSWSLNNEKSKLGERTFAPKEIVMVQGENALSIESHTVWQDQEMTNTDKLTLDGKECVNMGMMDTEKKSVATWSEDKTSLKVATKIDFQGQTITITDVYKLENGVLVVQSNSSSSFGDMSETRAYDKKAVQ
ncbi:MAG TPA: hypothetical protein P5084_11545 [Paludibacter sp.]|nr:hypothetical protein [Paludibacter sp.]